MSRQETHMDKLTFKRPPQTPRERVQLLRTLADRIHSVSDEIEAEYGDSLDDMTECAAFDGAMHDHLVRASLFGNLVRVLCRRFEKALQAEKEPR